MMTDVHPFHAPPEVWYRLKPLAREMRFEPTPADLHLWKYIRKRRINGVRFRHQYAIERFIVDFICLEHRLIIEVDGSIHDQQQEYDQIRQEFLEAQGFRVLRFTNGEVLQSIADVLTVISEAVHK